VSTTSAFLFFGGKMGAKSGGIYIERELFKSKAFFSLGKNSIRLLLALLDNRKLAPQKKGKPGKGDSKFSNLNSLTATYKQLHNEYDMPSAVITRAIDDLLAKGFVEIVHHGGTYKKDKTIFKLINKYLFWNKSTVFATRKYDIKRGFQGQMKGFENIILAHKKLG
jgi:DNA-binding MarR family transcriptional regulator